MNTRIDYRLKRSELNTALNEGKTPRQSKKLSIKDTALLIAKRVEAFLWRTEVVGVPTQWLLDEYGALGLNLRNIRAAKELLTRVGFWTLEEMSVNVGSRTKSAQYRVNMAFFEREETEWEPTDVDTDIPSEWMELFVFLAVVESGEVPQRMESLISWLLWKHGWSAGWRAYYSVRDALRAQGLKRSTFERFAAEMVQQGL